ncbi:DUF2079 domain-containing protein [Leptospira sanjuanensis]|uniref:DUF2079 domain-containing protein n=1 Tax=Leptospira sanjuanensis TaxID=2879643 RepID=UPI001EE91232|nr:DUF2079 domain-containing protein [Leptospira sanjuanensis]MCG6168723.1 DUF2079 domain-containing protein [Leptospira sanjuanensis]
MSVSVSFLPFFLLYLPIQILFGSKGLGGFSLAGILILCVFLHWADRKYGHPFFRSLKISPIVFISYWSAFVFAEGIFYTQRAAESFLLGDLDYAAQFRMILPGIDKTFFQTQYYGTEENANFLSHHMSPGILLLAPFAMSFGSPLGLGIGVFFFISISIPLLYFYLLASSVPKEIALCASLLWAGSSGLYRLGHSLHFEALVPFSILCVLIGVQKEKHWMTVLGLVFFLGIKEDLSFYLAALSAGLLLADPRKRKEWIFVLSVCLIYSFLIRPYLSGLAGSSAQRNWKEYWGQAAANPLWAAFSYIQKPESIYSYWKGVRDLSLEWGFWNWTGGWLLVPFFCLYSAFRLSVHPWVRDLYSYYVYPLIPFLILFLRTGSTWIQNAGNDFKPSRESESSFIRRIGFLKRIPKERKIFVLLLLTFAFSVYRNAKENEYPIPLQPQTSKAKELEEVLKSIPAGNSVSAGFHLSPFVSPDNPVYPIRENREWKEWIVLDHRYNSAYLSSELILQRIQRDVRNGKIEPVLTTKNFGLYRRSASPKR